MSDALDKAEAAVREASTDTAAVQLAFAAMELAKLAQQQPVQQPACQHQARTGRSAGEWLAIGGAVCVGSIGLAFASIALAIAACCATGCFLILRRLWQDMQRKGR
ncbi:hypothetical protein PV396_41895 [Streptomyces sp. ME02-8801-2C]|uniref:hypothetical protein n=1 Tax=Streptomyces sp. ME02-8801-2C TaxID=3028680 RepID=UPI0029B7E4EA|nr:hypothetical protein [Streptomyces sp. ME02-8801-2C]MDX3458418.1 hypothetical protein [Streptomyces sp. ME02-8801-2C]